MFRAVAIITDLIIPMLFTGECNLLPHNDLFPLTNFTPYLLSLPLANFTGVGIREESLCSEVHNFWTLIFSLNLLMQVVEPESDRIGLRLDIALAISKRTLTNNIEQTFYTINPV